MKTNVQCHEARSDDRQTKTCYVDLVTRISRYLLLKRLRRYQSIDVLLISEFHGTVVKAAKQPQPARKEAVARHEEGPPKS